MSRNQAAKLKRRARDEVGSIPSAVGLSLTETCCSPHPDILIHVYRYVHICIYIYICMYTHMYINLISHNMYVRSGPQKGARALRSDLGFTLRETNKLLGSCVLFSCVEDSRTFGWQN